MLSPFRMVSVATSFYQSSANHVFFYPLFNLRKLFYLIADLSVETISPQQIKKLSYYLDNWESIDFDDKRKAADGLISTIKATSDRVQIEWKI